MGKVDGVSILCNTIEQMAADADDKVEESFGLTLRLDDAKTIIRALMNMSKSKHGDWIEFIRSRCLGINEYGDPVLGHVMAYTCSECIFDNEVKSNFCPHCGAEMEVEQ